MQDFDVVIIGGGPGGINAGIMLSKAGKSVAMIQEEPESFGGTCLNRGCMPTKSLLKAATAYRYAKDAAKYGLDLLVGPVDLVKIRAVTDGDLAMLRGAVQGMLDQAGISRFRGKGSFESDRVIAINRNDGTREMLRGETIIIATGSRPKELCIAPFDGKHILSSDQMLVNTELPEKLLIVGGGAIGCEFATLYNTFGSDVIIAEAMESLLPREDAEAGKALQAAFETQGIKVKTGTAIERITVKEGKVSVAFKNGEVIDDIDKVLVGIGRCANIEGLNLEAAGVRTEGGAIKVNKLMETGAPGIYAVGDVAGGLTLAHAAEKQAQLLVQNLLKGGHGTLNQLAVPRVAFTHPEVAAVGASCEGAGVKAYTFPQVPNGRSVVDKVAPAFVKLFVKEETAELAGAVIVGEAATEMIHELALAVENGLTLQQVGATVHVHPTHSKNILQAIHGCA
ncbi:dihydrolipoyl dehydrogenase family protein [Geomonas edaphica]|uniref:dihydrolipoyl dehydrogenase family protein n=1 Tax=Geomonas edaphica TaxID=2570226 RepID=UPI0010A8C5AB|nr:NAD(P)/FAD-dependent oxidoreductase [Geomonas edaphica]